MEHAAVDREDGRSLRSGFLRSAARSPDSLALSIGKRTWAYAELERTARIWAHALLHACDGRPRQVGVLGYRSEVSFVGVTASLLAGATFVPLNPNFPPGRTRMMIELADLDAIIVQERYLPHLLQALPGEGIRPVILVPDAQDSLPKLGRPVCSGQALDELEPLVELPPVLESEIVYVLFTSGSTGVPKGVAVMHGNVLHFIDVMMDRYGLGPHDRLSQTYDQSFDPSIFDIFMAFEAGASLHVPSAIELVAPGAFINRQELTVWSSVPSIPSLMRKKNLLRPGTLPTLRWSLFCGEPLPRETAELWQAAAPSSVLENLYGPTELTITCLAYRWDPVVSPAECVNEIVPIGRPNPGVGVLIVDENGSPVPDGEPGELLVCGPQTVPGYWRAPDKTAERFVRVAAEIGTIDREATFYRTGDRVVRDRNGNYAHLGRNDQQIKLGGHRIELGEVEAVLRAIAGVLDAVAMAWPIRDGAPQGIVAFLTGTELSVAAVVSSAREVLPNYMVPEQVILVDRMPLNSNGKIDRRALLDGFTSAD